MNKFFFSIGLNKEENLNSILNLKFFYNKVIFEFNNCRFFSESKVFIENSMLKMVNFFLYKFMLFSYWDYSYKWLLEYNKLNKLKMRLIKPALMGIQHLIGFKFHFLGRFSRKQRAASIWFKEGYMPLNTLQCNIDYGCYHIPLKNSAVNVKVWMYKTLHYSNWIYKLV